MGSYTLELSCDGPVTRGRLLAAAWIDPASSPGFESEFEVPLQCSAVGRWRGFFNLSDVQVMKFYYRIGISGTAGGSWCLRILNRKSDAVVLMDSEQLDAGKMWLLGTCQDRIAMPLADRRRRLRQHSEVVCLAAHREERGSTTSSRG